MAVAHYLEALDWQREFIKIHAVLGGKNPHLQSFLVGGMATPVDPDKQASINVGSIALMRELIAKAKRLRRPRLHPRPAGRRLLLQGLGRLRRRGRQLPGLRRVPARTTASSRASSCPRGSSARGPREGRGLRPREDHRARQALLVRLRGRRRQGPPPVRGRDEAQLHGPGAALREARHRRQVQLAEVAALRRPADGGRPARADAGGLRLRPRAGQGAGGLGPRRSSASDPRPSSRPWAASPRAASRPWSSPSRWTAGSTSWPPTWASRPAHPRQLEVGPLELAGGGTGAGFHEAPRGALGHWVHIKDGAIANYQCVVPSTWNAGPRDAAGKRGPYEEALLGTPVADPEQAPRDPAHRPLLRPLHGVRRPRRGREAARARAGEGRMSAALPLTSRPPHRRCRHGSWCASTSGSGRCA